MTLKTPAGITRIEIPAKKTFGYMVRLRRGQHAVHEFFSDAKYRGKKRAEKAAKSHYKEVCAISLPVNSSHKNVLTKRNTSGKVGVRKTNTSSEDEKQTYPSWTASWVGKNKVRHSVSFSWNKYGAETAFAFASLARDHELTDRARILSLHH